MASTARQQGAVPQAQPVPGTAVPWLRDKQPWPGNELPQFLLPAVLWSGMLNNSGELLNCLENTSRSFLMSLLQTCHPRLEEQGEPVPPPTRRHQASTAHRRVPKYCDVAGWQVPKFLGNPCSSTSISAGPGHVLAGTKQTGSCMGACSRATKHKQQCQSQADSNEAETVNATGNKTWHKVPHRETESACWCFQSQILSAWPEPWVLGALHSSDG